jgi:hypothetical protein
MGEMVHVLFYDRPEVSVHHGGAGPLILPELRADLRGNRYGDAVKRTPAEFRHSQFMAGIKKREEQGDDHGINLLLIEKVNDFEDGILIKRHHHLAFTIHSFCDPFSQVPGHKRRQIGRAHV